MSSTNLSPEELSAHWSVPAKTLERWRCEGIGPRFFKMAGHVRYRREDVEQFESASMRSSTTERVAQVRL
ncbi:helix-turn-helix domain-containing protein [Lysobacter antibioticus]|uniref:helix-turn-helix domain-containing protein n=1 Tax=Lysobacter antibioticus TaxID=84531 RepID=UPI0004D034A5|nr:helix-turn-helix domain-containing protein [Lysobacter antibioticus]